VARHENARVSRQSPSFQCLPIRTQATSPSHFAEIKAAQEQRMEAEAERRRQEQEQHKKWISEHSIGSE
jgi:hypothetical protein